MDVHVWDKVHIHVWQLQVENENYSYYFLTSVIESGVLEIEFTL